MKKSMTEIIMRQNLRRALLPEVLTYPIETKTVRGFPDLVFSGFDATGVIELKSAKPDQPLTVPYRPGQQAFLYDHNKKNHRTFVLFFTNETYFLIDGREHYPLRYDSQDHLLRGSLWYGNDLRQLKLIVTS